MCLSGIAIKLPEGEYDTEPEEKVNKWCFYIIYIENYINQTNLSFFAKRFIEWQREWVSARWW